MIDATKIFKEAPPLSDADQRLIHAFERVGRTLDDLPYTDDFDRLHNDLSRMGDARDEREIWHRLVNLRKAARLPRMGRGVSLPAQITEVEAEILQDLVAHTVGTLGQRDRLPYTDQFQSIVHEFNRRAGRDLGPHEVWRLVARVAK